MFGEIGVLIGLAWVLLCWVDSDPLGDEKYALDRLAQEYDPIWPHDP